jgi:hypothetical protein
MRTIPYLRAGVCVSRSVAAALVLLMLFGVVFCKTPASPTNCKDACSAALTQCFSMQAGPAWTTYCESKHDECVAKCR